MTIKSMIICDRCREVIREHIETPNNPDWSRTSATSIQVQLPPAQHWPDSVAWPANSHRVAQLDFCASCTKDALGFAVRNLRHESLIDLFTWIKDGENL